MRLRRFHEGMFGHLTLTGRCLSQSQSDVLLSSLGTILNFLVPVHGREWKTKILASNHSFRNQTDKVFTVLIVILSSHIYFLCNHHLTFTSLLLSAESLWRKCALIRRRKHRRHLHTAVKHLQQARMHRVVSCVHHIIWCSPNSVWCT